MARRSKYTQDAQQRIVEALQLGATYQDAASYGGISYELFRQWMRDKVAFLAAVNACEGQAAMACLANIHKHAADDWHASAWVLERRFPERWGRRDRMQVNHSGQVDMRLAVRQIQATLDDVLPNDPMIRQRLAEKLLALEAGEQEAYESDNGYSD